MKKLILILAIALTTQEQLCGENGRITGKTPEGFGYKYTCSNGSSFHLPDDLGDI